MSQAPAPPVAGSVLRKSIVCSRRLTEYSVSNELGEWSSRIQGIYADGPYVWVQMSHDDEETQSVVLRLPRQTMVGDIVRALETVRFDRDSSSVVKVQLCD